MNTNGLRNAQKRRKVFALLRDYKCDIVMLQETHATQEIQQLWQSEWGGNAYFSNGTSNTRGILTATRKGLNCEILQIKTDLEGRVIIVELEIDGLSLLLANIYAPNIDDPDFFERNIKLIESFDNSNIVWAGDFNFVMNTDIDRFQSHHNNKKAMAVVSSYMTIAELTDVWRFKNPDSRVYTWHGQGRLQKSRIDMFLINDGMISKVINVDINPCNLSDHSILALSVKVSDQPRGPGLWKFNVSHLSNQQFLNQLNETVEEASTMAANLEPSNKWEFVKMMIINFARAKSKEILINSNKKLIELYHELEKLQRLMDNAPDRVDDVMLQKHASINKDIKDIQDKRCMGAKMRCKSTYYEQGERSSKYFFSLEQSKANMKKMRCLHLDDGSEITNQCEILQEQYNFYKNLYDIDPNVQFQNLLTDDHGKLSNEERRCLDSPLLLEEFSQAVNQMPNCKTPGCDGLPVEIYKVLWSRIKNLVYEAMIHALETKELAQAMRRGVITLIPKKERIH